MLTDDGAKTISCKRDWGYRALHTAAGMSRKEVMRKGAQLFDATNVARVTYTSKADWGMRTAAIDQALYWAGICRYMDTTNTDCFRPVAYKMWEWRPPQRKRKYVALINPGAYVLRVRIAYGTKPVTFYKPKQGHDDPTGSHEPNT